MIYFSLPNEIKLQFALYSARVQQSLPKLCLMPAGRAYTGVLIIKHTFRGTKHPFFAVSDEQRRKRAHRDIIKLSHTNAALSVVTLYVHVECFFYPTIKII